MSEPIEDFSLSSGKEDEDSSSSNLEHRVLDKSSMPLPIRVGRGGKEFSKTPFLAYEGVPSTVNLVYGRCQFAIKSGPILIDQFIWTNRWVKLQMGLPANQDVILEVAMYGNFRAAMDVYPVISAKMLKPCQNKFQGKKTLLGKFHFNRTQFGIIRATGATKANFKRRGNNRVPRSIYLNWPKGETSPQLQDQFELPSNLASPIHRAKFNTAGRYYLSVKPILAFKVAEASMLSVARPQSLNKVQRKGH